MALLSVALLSVALLSVALLSVAVLGLRAVDRLLRVGLAVVTRWTVAAGCSCSAGPGLALSNCLALLASHRLSVFSTCRTDS